MAAKTFLISTSFESERFRVVSLSLQVCLALVSVGRSVPRCLSRCECDSSRQRGWCQDTVRSPAGTLCRSLQDSGFVPAQLFPPRPFEARRSSWFLKCCKLACRASVTGSRCSLFSFRIKLEMEHSISFKCRYSIILPQLINSGFVKSVSKLPIINKSSLFPIWGKLELQRPNSDTTILGEFRRLRNSWMDILYG